ncbi:MAG: triose-phosphate isomerase [Firmicutes bacterium]|nr:triose-phosphate isomerase [Bacillota bacterium]
MRKKMLVANWKMYKTRKEAAEFVRHFLQETEAQQPVEIVICAPFTALADLAVLLKDSGLRLGAQNMYWPDEGAFTGEISPLMLKEIGVGYVLIGHSERRRYFGEEETLIRKKVAAALAHGLKPVLCVGEDEKERHAGRTGEVIQEQLWGALDGLDLKDGLGEKIVLAYEPVWAIGTGTPARGRDADAVAGLIRSLLLKKGYGPVEGVRILYGGSVQAGNIAEFTTQKEIDGALVGGSSLAAADFAALVKAMSDRGGT